MVTCGGVAHATRSRHNSEYPVTHVYVHPQPHRNAPRASSGVPTADAHAPPDAPAHANRLRADEYITGTVTKTPTGVKVVKLYE